MQDIFWMPEIAAVTWAPAPALSSLYPSSLCKASKKQEQAYESHVCHVIRIKIHPCERRKIIPITVRINLEITVVSLIILIHNSASNYKRWRGVCPTFPFVIWQHFCWAALPWKLAVAQFPLLCFWAFRDTKDRRKSGKRRGNTNKTSQAITAHRLTCASPFLTVCLQTAQLTVSFWTKRKCLLLLMTGGQI